MAIYLFSGWPIGMAEDEYPASFLANGTAPICDVEFTSSVSEALPDCRDRLVFAPELTALGINADSFTDDHIFGNGSSCALVVFDGNDGPMKISWVVTPTADGTLSSEKYAELQAIMVKEPE
jgi:hypothetical protein